VAEAGFKVALGSLAEGSSRSSRSEKRRSPSTTAPETAEGTGAPAGACTDVVGRFAVARGPSPPAWRCSTWTGAGQDRLVLPKRAKLLARRPRSSSGQAKQEERAHVLEVRSEDCSEMSLYSAIR